MTIAKERIGDNLVPSGGKRVPVTPCGAQTQKGKVCLALPLRLGGILVFFQHFVNILFLGSRVLC